MLGEISFALYLIYQIVFRFYMLHKSILEPLPKDAIFPSLVITAFAFAYGIWRLVDLSG